MKRIKEIAVSIFVVVLIGITLSVPVWAVTFYWSFDMSTNGRVVDGNKNGVYHKLSKGYVKIKGSIYTEKNAKGDGQPTNYVHFQLYNKSSGNCFGDIKKKPSGTALKSVDFSGVYSKKVGGGNKYYLVIWRGDSDGTSIGGSGKCYHYDK